MPPSCASHGSHKGLAMTSDCTPRYVQAHPETGGKQAVAEAWRNITAVGARPLAVTDNMNFGNPQKPEIMGQFAGAIMGMAEACTALDFPVVSGNVSLYNETEGRPILPTPTIGAVGVIDDIAKAVGSRLDAGAAWPSCWSARPRAGSASRSTCARLLRPRGRRAAAGRPRGRAPQRRLRARPDRSAAASRPATTCPTAACWSAWPRCASPAAPASTVAAAGRNGVPVARVFLWRGSGPLSRRHRLGRRRAGRRPQAAGVPAVAARLLGRRRRSSVEGPAVAAAQRHQGRPRGLAARPI